MDKQMIIDALVDPTVVEKEITRRDAVRGSGMLGLGLAAAAVPAALMAWSSKAFAQGAALPNKIVNALNVAYILENLEADYYNEGLAASGLIPAADRPIFEQIAKHENAHVAFLEGVLGSRAAQLPEFDFTSGGTLPIYTDYDTFKLVAQGFEDFGVRAYKGQAGNLAGNDTMLTAALSIHSVEARHASVIRRLRGGKGWITGNSGGPGVPADFPFAVVYGGEGTTMQAGIDTAKYFGADAASEAFDEPVTNLQDILRVVSVFIAK